MMNRFTLIYSGAISLITNVQSANVTLVKSNITDESDNKFNAFCMDGSLPAYYFKE